MLTKFFNCGLKLSRIMMGYWERKGTDYAELQISPADLTYTTPHVIQFDYCVKLYPWIGGLGGTGTTCWRHWNYYPATEVFEYAPWQHTLSTAGSSFFPVTPAEKVLALELLGAVI